MVDEANSKEDDRDSFSKMAGFVTEFVQK